MEIQIIDIVQTKQNEIIIVGKDREGHINKITRTSHSPCFYIEVDEDFKMMDKWKQSLNGYLQNNVQQCSCTDICRHSRRGTREALVMQNRGMLVKDIFMCKGRGYEVYQEKESTFVCIVLALSFHLMQAVGYMKRSFQVSCCYQVIPDAVDSFMYESGLAVFDWFDVMSGEVNKEEEDVKWVVMALTIGVDNGCVIGIECEMEGVVKRFEHDAEDFILKLFFDYFRGQDPDIVIGYGMNIQLLLNRSRGFGVDTWISRVQGEPICCLKGVVDCPGRVFIELQETLSDELNLCSWDEVKDRFGTLREVERHLGTIQNMMVRCKLMRITPRDLMHRGIGFQWTKFLMTRLKKGGYYLPDVPTKIHKVNGYDEAWKDYEGGSVKEPIIGFHKSPIVTFDFESFYVNIIRTFNVDASTQLLVGDKLMGEVSPSGFGYYQGRVGVIPGILNDLADQRIKVKERLLSEGDEEKKTKLNILQRQLKLIGNSIYGLMGSPNSRLCLMSGATSVSAWGRFYLDKVCHSLEDDYNVAMIYGDTDSVFLEYLGGDGLVEEYAKGKLEWINSVLLKGTLKMNMEETADSILLLNKKMYAKMIGDKLKMVGIGKRTLPQYHIDVLERLLAHCMKGGSGGVVMEGLIHAAIEEMMMAPKRRLKHGVDLSKDLSEYKEPYPIHVTVARQEPMDKNYGKGDRVEFYYVQGTPKVKRVDLMGPGDVLDFPYYIEEMHRMLEMTTLCFIEGENEDEKQDNLMKYCYQGGGVKRVMKKARVKQEKMVFKLEDMF